MKTHFLILSLAFAGGLLARAADTPVAALQPRSAHPYLFYTDAQVAKLKERLATDKAAAEAWAALLASANQAVARPDGGGDRGIETLCLAYRMTGERKFAGRVRDNLLRQIQRVWNTADLEARDPVWHSGLGTGRSCYTVAVGFDCIYDALSPDDRRTIAAGLVDRGILPILNDWVLGARRIHALDTMGHNWWSACVFNAGIAAMAVLDEEPRARGWLERIAAGSVEWLDYAGSVLENKPANFDAAGGFYESANYASFGVSQYLFFRLAWQNAFAAPLPAPPLVDRLGDYFLHVAYPNSGRLMSVNFGDGSITVEGSRPLTLLWALGDRKPRYLWYLAQARREQFREGLESTSPFGLVFAPGEADLAGKPAAPDLPTATLFKDMGWAMLRSSWDKDATLLAVRSGFTWNHAHADTGSFVLFHRGRYLLIDSGNSSYATPEYDDYYRQSVAHNVVLFNGRAENAEDTYFGSKTDGTLSHLLDAGDLRYVLADATGPTSQSFARNYRNFLWIGEVILVIDDLKSYEPGQFEWLLHFNGTGRRRGQDVTIADGDASVVVRPLFPETLPDAGLPTDYPENMRLVEKTGLKDHEPATKLTYYSFQPTELTRRTKFITAILPVKDGAHNALPQLERLRALDLIGVRIRQNDTVTDVWLNLKADGSIRHRNANLAHDGWETDAYLTALTWPAGAALNDPDAATRLFVADGSYLRRDGKVVLDSLSKVFLAATKKPDGTLDVQLQGQPVINADLRAAQRPAAIRLNGQRIAPPYDATAGTVTLSLPTP